MCMRVVLERELDIYEDVDVGGGVVERIDSLSGGDQVWRVGCEGPVLISPRCLTRGEGGAGCLPVTVVGW